MLEGINDIGVDGFNFPALVEERIEVSELGVVIIPNINIADINLG